MALAGASHTAQAMCVSERHHAWTAIVLDRLPHRVVPTTPSRTNPIHTAGHEPEVDRLRDETIFAAVLLRRRDIGSASLGLVIHMVADQDRRRRWCREETIYPGMICSGEMNTETNEILGTEIEGTTQRRVLHLGSEIAAQGR